jgi:hypothetical protein
VSNATLPRNGRSDAKSQIFEPPEFWVRPAPTARRLAQADAEALKAYLFGSSAKSFIDLREPGAGVPLGHVHAALPATAASMGASRSFGFRTPASGGLLGVRLRATL